MVDTWDNQYTLSVDHLSSLRFAPAEESQMLDLGARMTALAEVGELDEAALWLLQGLERLNRCQLNSLEEKLLQILEQFYIFHDVE